MKFEFVRDGYLDEMHKNTQKYPATSPEVLFIVIATSILLHSFLFATFG